MKEIRYIARGFAVSASLVALSVTALAEPPPPQSKAPSKDRPAATAPREAQVQPPAPPPDTPLRRSKRLRDLYAQLAAAPDQQQAQKHAQAIERIWQSVDSDTAQVLMERAGKAAADKRFDLALNLMGVAVELAPDQAEVWNRRAYVHYLSQDVGRALGDLRRAIAIDPSHFKALDGLATMLKEIGQKKGALAAYRRLQEVHPFWPNIDTSVEELAREVEGQEL
jgi:tetratricopeptide (TPR) repeat protein